MRELVDRLSALDPDASESLKVIAYFDALIEGRAGLEAFLRGAAMLTGCPAGLVLPEYRIRMRVDADGRRADPPGSGGPGGATWPRRPFPDDPRSLVWIEREGRQHANDAMVLERLAAGARITVERTQGGPADGAAVEMLLDPATAPEARRHAAWRLGLDERSRVLVTASPPHGRPPRGHIRTALMPTVAGRVLASIRLADPGPGDTAAGERPAGGRTGIGPAGRMTDLPRSFDGAVTALRLTSPARPVLRWDDLGPLTVLAAGADTLAGPHPDVLLIERAAAGDWAVGTLEALAAHSSVRAAAAALGVHHSTVQARLEQLEAVLGHPLTTSDGRTRLTLALALYHLRHNRFGEDERFDDPYPPIGG